jgi:hypothetical protein
VYKLHGKAQLLVRFVAHLLLAGCGASHGLAALGAGHKYDGSAHFDLSKIPFSRYGSYLAISHMKGSASLLEGLYVRDLHGSSSGGKLFRIELLQGGNPAPFREVASPELLRLEAAEGYVEICIAEPAIVLIRGAGVGFRLLVPPPHSDYAFPLSTLQWQVTSRTRHMKFLLTARAGTLAVDAPWQGTHADRVVADFLPDPATGKLQGMLEEFSSVPGQPYQKSFDDALDSLRSKYRQWLEKMPQVSEEFGAAAELAAYVDWESVVAPEGHLTRPAMLMSKNWMSKVWSWDNCFNAMALADGNPQLAWDQFMLLIDNQDSRGAFPDWMDDQAVSWLHTKPPILGWVLAWMMQRTQFIGREQLTQVYEPLSRWTNWYFKYRDVDHDGIPEYDHGNDSGWDNSTIFLIRPPVEAPDLSAYLIIQMAVLSDVARTLGKPDDGLRWKKRADELLTTLLARCWNGKEFVAPEAGTHAHYSSQSLILYLPIILGNRLPKPVLAQLIASLKEKGNFLTENGLATESLKSPNYLSDGYWRGPIWAPAMMVITAGLDAVGEQPFADDLRLRFCRMVAQSGVSENFDAVTGTGLRDPSYTWTSSVFLIFAHQLFQKNACSAAGVRIGR